MINHVLLLLFSVLILGVLVVLLLPKETSLRTIGITSSTTSFLAFLISLLTLFGFNKAESELQFALKKEWIESFNINFYLGVDGLNILFVTFICFTYFIVFLSLSEKNSSKWLGVNAGYKGFFSLMLISEIFLLQLFLAQDLFLFVCLWVASIIPFYLLISTWGFKDKENTSNRFFLYQITSSGFLLLGMITVFFFSSNKSFELLNLSKISYETLTMNVFGHQWNVQSFMHLIFLIGFLARVPSVPVHSWMPLVQEDAPAQVSSILSTVFCFSGIYAILRINYLLFPNASMAHSTWLSVLGLLNIIYSTLHLLNQRNLKKIGAYLTLYCSGIALIGISAIEKTSLQGTIHFMISAMMSLSICILLIGMLSIILKNSQLNEEPVFSSLILKRPLFTFLFTIGLFSILSVPGTGGFVGNTLILLGFWSEKKNMIYFAVLATILLYGFFVWFYRRVFLGSSNRVELGLNDLTFSGFEKLYSIPLAAMIFVLGFFPNIFLNFTQTYVVEALKYIQGAH